jgi:hypothetical protein
MSGLAELALIRQAFEALPNGTPHERTLWIQQRKREMASQPVSERQQPVSSGPKPFSQIADDPAVVRAGRER